MFDKEIYVQRRAALKAKINTGIGLFMGNREAPCNYKDNTYPFRQDSTFLYFLVWTSPIWRPSLILKQAGKSCLQTMSV